MGKVGIVRIEHEIKDGLIKLLNLIGGINQFVSKDGAKIAVINGNCNKITLMASDPLFTNGSKLYFEYHSATY